MHDEYDYEIDQAREWLGLDQDAPLTFGEMAWTAVQMLAASALILGGGMVAGIITGDL